MSKISVFNKEHNAQQIREIYFETQLGLVPNVVDIASNYLSSHILFWTSLIVVASLSSVIVLYAIDRRFPTSLWAIFDFSLGMKVATLVGVLILTQGSTLISRYFLNPLAYKTYTRNVLVRAEFLFTCFLFYDDNSEFTFSY
jgi:hypothetical protein